MIPQLDEAKRAQIQALRTKGRAVREALRSSGSLPLGSTVQSGYFTIADGGLEMGGRNEASSDAGASPGEGSRLASKGSVVTNADGIIRNSLCVGFDCPNSPSFGDTTILMMENNTRIKFDDTSSVGGFPNRDWEIEANSNLSGGANYLGFNDCGNSSQGGCATDLVFAVEAGVRQNALYVESDGDVGFGTSNPVANLHAVDGDSPTLRLEQDGSSGFAPQSWDVAGNETSFFVRDVTNGSTLPFRIFPESPSNTLVVRDGNVGLGTSSPDFDLDIDNGTLAAANFVVRGTSGSMILQDQNATSGQQAAQNLVSAGTWKLRGLSDDLGSQTVRGIAVDLADGDVGILCDSSLNADLTVGSQGSCSSGTRSTLNAGDTMFTASSSRTIKEHLEPLEVDDILEKIQEIPVYHYDFITGPKDRVGLVAEDFHQVFERGSDQVLSGQEVQMALWLAVQELTKRTEEQRVAELEKEVAELKVLVEALTAER